MSALLFQIITTAAQLVILLFILYYMLVAREKEHELKKKEAKLDAAYRQSMEEALEKERKIIDNATIKADDIIADAQRISQNSQKILEQALEKMVMNMHTEATDTAQNFIKNYENSLKMLADESIKDFKTVDKESKEALQQQLKIFNESQLTTIQKELEEYKQTRMKDAEKLIIKVVQKVSQDVLKSAISMDDHQKLLVDSLEKAKKEGLFE
jgi:restriction endonuclease